MKRKNLGIKIVITIFVFCLFAWFLVVSPMLSFQKNENKIKEAAMRYFELYSNELPTGERVKTLSLQNLYYKSFLKEDLYIPYSKKVCSIENSWVKVRRENGDYHYYVYLECGLIKSHVDHVGPVIKLKGDSKVTISLGDTYKEAGIYSVVDDHDGKIDPKNVIIKGNVDTNKVGVYTLTYTAIDRFSNKRSVEREVEVVQDLYNTVKKLLDGQKNFVGNPNNNYLQFSNILFRIYGIDSDKNIRIVANQDISNVNYSSLDQWLDYFYNHLMEDSKKMIVDTKYCNMNLTSSTLDTTQCNSYTKKKKVYIPSVIDVNLANKSGTNFMKPMTMSWLSNKADSKTAFLTRDVFFGKELGKNYLAYAISENYGVRPMLSIKGDSYIIDGDGSYDSPYILNDFKKTKTNTLLNERYSGEYIIIGSKFYRIIETMKDGTVKVISHDVVEDADGYVLYNTDISNSIVYDVKNKNSIGYYINNKIPEYVDTSYFVNHEVNVPIYKKNIMYKKESSNKTIKGKLFAPDMYELFSSTTDFENSYWLINSSKNSKIVGGIYEIGVPINEILDSNVLLGIRVVGFIKENATIVSGKGTYQSPFILK